jgi:uncharacterized protein YqeY
MTLLLSLPRANRQELVDKETRERDILMQYMPAQKSEAEIRAMIKEIIAAIPAAERNQGCLDEGCHAQAQRIWLTAIWYDR